MPLARTGLRTLPPNMPKRKAATRFASSRLGYHIESVYTAWFVTYFAQSQNLPSHNETSLVSDKTLQCCKGAEDQHLR
jgi:hypothetical protein